MSIMHSLLTQICFTFVPLGLKKIGENAILTTLPSSPCHMCAKRCRCPPRTKSNSLILARLGQQSHPTRTGVSIGFLGYLENPVVLGSSAYHRSR